MNLKEVANESKIYAESKNELIKLIQDFLLKYGEYKGMYNELYKKWCDKIVDGFKTIFLEENFDIKEQKSNYIAATSGYITIKAILYDLEFELSLDNSSSDKIRFLQNKPKTDGKNIILRPTVKEYNIKIQVVVELKKVSIYSINDLKKINDSIENAEYSIKEMQELYTVLAEEMSALLVEVDKIKSTYVKSMAIDSNNYGFKSDKNYGEFDSFKEFIDML